MRPKLTLPLNTCICRDLDCAIPYGKCHCGCGGDTCIAPISSVSRFMINGTPMRYIFGHGTKGKPSEKRLCIDDGLCVCRNPSCLIPYGTCHCGCGEKTTIARQGCRDYGHISGMPKLFINGHQCRVDVVERFWKNVDKDGPTVREELGACWRWKGGFVTDYGFGWDSIKKSVLKKANRICERCGKSQARDVHHIIPFRCFETHIEANAISNLKALCVECHRIEEVINNNIPLLSGMRYPQTSFYGLLQEMRTTNRKKETAAHRISWIIHFGEIPDKMFICHRCNNPECTNPAHLYLGTVRDNNDDIFRRRKIWRD